MSVNHLPSNLLRSKSNMYLIEGLTRNSSIPLQNIQRTIRVYPITILTYQTFNLPMHPPLESAPRIIKTSKYLNYKILAANLKNR